MLKFGPVQGEAFPHHHLIWDTGCLRECIARYLDEGPRLDVKGVRLPKTFHAWSVVAIGGIQVEFTDNLADHLLLIEEESGIKVLIFHHVSFLRCHQSSIYPVGFLEETLETLQLLFPESEFGGTGISKRRRWSWYQKLLSKQPCPPIDWGLGSIGTLSAEARRIERFRFWRNRLIVLKQAYDDATPRTISQWWHDRRNRVVWCTFWLAILVLVLGALVGVVQCVQGGLQVSKS
ncbi:hypothetical protein CMEL01_12759 [Colletotrichum melonis]|uniref:Uncharacterized protein n=1 Tax=Colletotrichum melonis TaxID=1209925 RepID=A0AAI9UXQ8_9PEZI|nr:hypothetical protein CMEL01_12759 [Colletotrichum melonis]